MTTLALLHYGPGAMNYALILSFLTIPYFFFFQYMNNQRLAHKQHKNLFKVPIDQFELVNSPNNDKKKGSVLTEMSPVKSIGLQKSLTKRESKVKSTVLT